MAKAQGGLEYLIIIGAAIAITAVVTLFVINYFGANTEQYFYASCRQAASTCNVSLSINPFNPCVVCDNACNYTNGTEIFPNAINCCKFGKTIEIYSGSPGCAYTVPTCGNGVVDTGEECDPPGSDCTTGGTCNSGCTCPVAQTFTVTITSPQGGTNTSTSVVLEATSTHNANCNYGPTLVELVPMGEGEGTTSHSQLLEGLPLGELTYYVSCLDVTGAYTAYDYVKWNVSTCLSASDCPSTYSYCSGNKACTKTYSCVSGACTASTSCSDCGDDYTICEGNRLKSVDRYCSSGRCRTSTSWSDCPATYTKSCCSGDDMSLCWCSYAYSCPDGGSSCALTITLSSCNTCNYCCLQSMVAHCGGSPSQCGY